jgi:hypothetical protein
MAIERRIDYVRAGADRWIIDLACGHVIEPGRVAGDEPPQVGDTRVCPECPSEVTDG